jgi:predicted histidine transporter YuiF (NhaC family)
MSSSKEIRKRKKIDSKKTIHFVLMVFSIRKYNEIDITIAGIRIMPPPLGIDCL